MTDTPPLPPPTTDSYVDVYAFASSMSLEAASRAASRHLTSPGRARFHFVPTAEFLELTRARGYTWRQDAVVAEHYFDRQHYDLTDAALWLSQGRTYRATGGDVDYDAYEERWVLGIKDELDVLLVRSIVGDREEVEAAMRERDLGGVDDANAWYCQSLTTRFRLWDGDAPLPVYVSLCFTNDEAAPDMAIGRCDGPPGEELRSLRLAPSMSDARLTLLSLDRHNRPGVRPHATVLPDCYVTDAFVARFLEEHRGDVAFPEDESRSSGGEA